MSQPGEIIQIGDARAMKRIEDHCDVVVIGTGAAGAPAARVLAAAGLDVVMLEEGPFVPLEVRRHDQWTGFKQAWRDVGFQVAQAKGVLPILQGRSVGGSTTINGAIVHRIPESIHARWVDEFGWGDAVSMKDLDRIYDRLDDELSVAPAPEPTRGQNNRLMGDGADAMGIHHNVIRRNVIGCRATARCLQACPTGRKQSMDVTMIPRAMKDGARLYATCRAERFLRAAGRVTGVEGVFVDPVTGERGPEMVVHAKRVIVAASAIQSPLLLLANGIRGRSKRVGQRLQAHPGVSIMATFDEPVDMWFGATQGHETTHWWDEKMKFESVGVPLEVGAARLPGFGRALMERVADWGHVVQWGVQVRSDFMGRVRRGLFGGTSIRYGFSANDIAIIKIGLKRLTEMAFLAGATSLYPGIHGLPDVITSVDEMNRIDDVPNDPRLFHGIASHLFGTTMMGPDPATSVVGLDGQVHDVPGLYVLDSSLYPTNMGVNPAHTISAISWHLAERIAGV